MLWTEKCSKILAQKLKYFQYKTIVTAAKNNKTVLGWSKLNYYVTIITSELLFNNFFVVDPQNCY